MGPQKCLRTGITLPNDDGRFAQCAVQHSNAIGCYYSAATFCKEPTRIPAAGAEETACVHHPYGQIQMTGNVFPQIF